MRTASLRKKTDSPFGPFVSGPSFHTYSSASRAASTPRSPIECNQFHANHCKVSVYSRPNALRQNAVVSTFSMGSLSFDLSFLEKRRRSSSPDSLRSFKRQSRQRQLSVSVGIGPCGSSAHQQFPFGLQIIGALHREQRVSMRTIIAQSPSGPVVRNCSRAFVPNHYKIKRCFPQGP